jgi:hypothetical protein
MLIRFLIMHRDIDLGCDQGLIGVKTFSVDQSCSDHLHSYIKIAIIFYLPLIYLHVLHLV